MTDLKHPETYYYRVGDGVESWSEVMSFKTLGVDDTLTYAVIADMDFEQNDTVARIQEMVENGAVHAVIHSGDISYADGYQPHWDAFLNHVIHCVPSRHVTKLDVFGKYCCLLYFNQSVMVS